MRAHYSGQQKNERMPDEKRQAPCHDQSEPLVPHYNYDTNHNGRLKIVKFWFQRHPIWWLLLTVILISFLLSF